MNEAFAPSAGARRVPPPELSLDLQGSLFFAEGQAPSLGGSVGARVPAATRWARHLALEVFGRAITPGLEAPSQPRRGGGAGEGDTPARGTQPAELIGFRRVTWGAAHLRDTFVETRHFLADASVGAFLELPFSPYVRLGSQARWGTLDALAARVGLDAFYDRAAGGGGTVQLLAERAPTAAMLVRLRGDATWAESRSARDFSAEVGGSFRPSRALDAGAGASVYGSLAERRWQTARVWVRARTALFHPWLRGEIEPQLRFRGPGVPGPAASPAIAIRLELTIAKGGRSASGARCDGGE